MKKVEIYTWSTCPFCVRAKALLSKENIEYQEFEISRDSNKLSELKNQTGSGTVPQIFVDGEFIGGCDDLMSIHRKGQFDKVFR